MRGKYVLFQSDDWGMERMINPETYNRLLKLSIPVDQNPYSRLDSFERDDDLIRLAALLSRFKDGHGNPVRFTMNNVMGNPDFERIRQSDFREYYFQPFTRTKDRYPDSSGIINIYKEGIDAGVFEMAFHGREHLHVNHWMQKLAKGDKGVRVLFDEGIYSASLTADSSCLTDNLDAMGIYDRKDESMVALAIREGVSVFREIWGSLPDSFIAPCYTWDSTVEQIFSDLGVSVIQSGIGQNVPVRNTMTRRTERRKSGERSEQGQYYAIRNVSFEPSLDKEKDWVSAALWEISNAFTWNVPAVIESHRINYMSSMSEANAAHGLVLLDELLSGIIKNWPDVTFLSTSDIKKIYAA